MKKSLLILFLLFLALFAVASVIPFRPSITITNETGKRLYIRSSEGVHGIEPDPEEMEKIKRAVPEVIEPGERIRIIPSFSVVMTQGGQLNIGWLVAGRYSYNALGGGRQTFLFTSKTGMCSVTLRVRSGYNKATLENSEDRFCFYKVTPFDVVY